MGDQTQAYDIFQTPLSSGYPLPLNGVWNEILSFKFFHKLVSPGSLSVPLGPFWIFSKICRNIRESMFISGLNDTSDKRENFEV